MAHWGVTALAGALFFTLILGGASMGKEAAKIGVIVVDVQGDFTKFKNGSYPWAPCFNDSVQ